MLLGACVVAQAPTPAPYAEAIRIVPFVGAVWISGCWNWSRGRHTWVDGQWHRRGGGWVRH